MAKQTENYELPLEMPGAGPTAEAVFAEAMQKIEAGADRTTSPDRCTVRTHHRVMQPRIPGNAYEPDQKWSGFLYACNVKTVLINEFMTKRKLV